MIALRERARWSVDRADVPLLEKLKPQHREALAAAGSYTQIAAALGVPIGTIKSRISRGRKELEALKTQGESHVEKAE